MAENGQFAVFRNTWDEDPLFSRDHTSIESFHDTTDEAAAIAGELQEKHGEFKYGGGDDTNGTRYFARKVQLLGSVTTKTSTETVVEDEVHYEGRVISLGVVVTKKVVEVTIDEYLAESGFKCSVYTKKEIIDSPETI